MKRRYAEVKSKVTIQILNESVQETATVTYITMDVVVGGYYCNMVLLVSGVR